MKLDATCYVQSRVFIRGCSRALVDIGMVDASVRWPWLREADGADAFAKLTDMIARTRPSGQRCPSCPLTRSAAQSAVVWLATFADLTLVDAAALSEPLCRHCPRDPDDFRTVTHTPGLRAPAENFGISMKYLKP